MTLIINIKCKNGIVVAADTLGTIPTVSGIKIGFGANKIFKIGNHALFSGSGSIGTIQRAVDILQEYSARIDKGLDTKLRNEIIKKLGKAYNERLDTYRIFHKDDKEKNGWTANIMIACLDKNTGKPVLWQIPSDLNDEILKDLDYYAAGIGDMAAYALLKHLYKKDVDIEKGMALAQQIVQTVSEINPFVGNKATIAYLDHKGNLGEKATD